MIPRNNILNNISELKSLSDNKTFKYRRNYRYYNATAPPTIETKHEMAKLIKPSQHQPSNRYYI